MTENKAENKKQQYEMIFYYVVIFVLSVAMGYYLKSIAKHYVTVGYEDSKLIVGKSNVDFKEISEKAKEINQKMQEEQLKAMQEAQAAQGGSGEAAETVTTGASCGE